MGKTALVLSGGGLAGAVYHIGAMRALNDALLDRSVNDFDMYVGTSAGAVIASCLANGIRTKDLLRSVSGQAGPVNLHRGDVFMPNYKEFAAKLFGLPLTTAHAIWHALMHVGDMDLFDFGALFADALPSGFFDSEATARYLHRVFDFVDGTDDFRQLEKELVVIATDLDNGDRTVFGSGHNDRVPISKAAAASAAVPVLYTPINIDGRDYVDGGLRGTASIDVAIEHGCDLIICVNPLVPFDNTAQNIPRTRIAGPHRPREGLQRDHQPDHPDQPPRRAAVPPQAGAPGPPRGRHHRDPAQAHRRADVLQQPDALQLPDADRPTRLRVGDRGAGREPRQEQGDPGPARPGGAPLAGA